MARGNHTRPRARYKGSSRQLFYEQDTPRCLETGKVCYTRGDAKEAARRAGEITMSVLTPYRGDRCVRGHIGQRNTYLCKHGE